MVIKNFINKKTTLLLILLLTSPKIFAQIGFSVSNTTAFLEKNEYSPSYSNSLKSSLFYIFDYSSINKIFSIAPEIRYDYETYPKFGIHYFTASFLSDIFLFKLGKNKIESNIGNIYKTNFPYNAEQTDSSGFWQMNLSLFQNYFTYRLKYVLDTHNIEEYKMAEWGTGELQIGFDKANLESNFSNDFYYNWQDNKFIYSAGIFSNYIINEKINFYGDAKYAHNDIYPFKTLAGITYTHITKNTVNGFSVEYSFIEKMHILGFFMNFNLNDKLNAYAGIKKNSLDLKELGIVSELSLMLNNYTFKALFEWKDIFKNEKILKLGIAFNEI